ncbi:pyridoxamine 5'-phosphate oxidase family protein [soil metagenome]|jgi:hypothetical protein
MGIQPEDPVLHLQVHECWELLRGTDLGRLAVIVDGTPEIFPLTFVVDHGTLVFRSAAGTKLSAGYAGPVAFEIDGRDDSTAWSVVVHGQLEPLISFEPLDTEALPLYPLQPGQKPRFVRIVAESVTGRWFSTVGPEAWHTAGALPHSPAWE